MVKKMKAAVLHAPGDLRIEEVPIPSLGLDDLLVKVSACGICGSDVPRILTEGTYHFPTIPGHEFSGTVVKSDSKKRDTLIGQKVAVIPLIPCRKCKFCEIGKFAQCEKYGFLGSRDDGGFAEYVKVPYKNIVRLPEEVSLEEGAMIEPVSVALHAVKNMGISWGDEVAVFGLGAIGNFIAQWAKAYGARHIFAIDIVKEKIKIANEVGLIDSINGKDDNWQDIILEKTEGKGVDVSIEASGSNRALSDSINLLRMEGKLGLVGRQANGAKIDDALYEKILRAQILIKGTWSFEFTDFPHNAWTQSIEAIRKNNIAIKPLISHRLTIYETFKAVKMLKNRGENISKILIKP